MRTCQICGNALNRSTISARERMFGTGDPFQYFLCEACGCLQIAARPDNLVSYYPKDYYSLRPCLLPEAGMGDRFRNALESFFSGFISKFPPIAALWKASPNFDRVFIDYAVSRHSRILDIGCGEGRLLYALSVLGFQDLTGVDPFLEQDISYSPSVRVYKKSLFELNGKWDLIMFHHCFEHIWEQLDTLKAVRELLSDKGICLIRIPTVSSYAWEHYGPNWVQLDAPRHLFLHSHESFKVLAQKAGFKILKIVCDSTEFQFWGSEKYQRGEPLLLTSGCDGVSPQAIFLRISRVLKYRQAVRRLNAQGRGDQIAIYLIADKQNRGF